MKAQNTPSKLIVLTALLVVAVAAGSALEVKGQPLPKRVRTSFDMLKIGSDQTAEFNVVSRAEVSTRILVEFHVYDPAPDRPEAEPNKYQLVQRLSHQVTLAPGEGVSIPFPNSNDQQRISVVSSWITASLVAHVNAFGISVPISQKGTGITNIILIPCDY